MCRTMGQLVYFATDKVVYTTVVLVFHAISVLADLKCRDWQGFDIENGMQFQPKSDPCQQCLCENGFTTACTAVACAPPSDCKHIQRVDGSCCKYRCMDGTDFYPDSGLNGTNPNDNQNGSEDDMTSLGLRLVASTLTSFLILALLLFLVHRLRQRRLLLIARRQRRREHMEDMERECYIPEPFMGIEFPPYEDPPPPYTPPKPPHLGQLEEPPPYETIDRNQNRQPLNNNNINNNNNTQSSNYSNGLLIDSTVRNAECSRNVTNSFIPSTSSSAQCSDHDERNPTEGASSSNHGSRRHDRHSQANVQEGKSGDSDSENTEIKRTEAQSPVTTLHPHQVESVIEQLIRNISPPPPYSSSDQLRYDYLQRLNNVRQREFLDSTSSSYSPSEEYIPSNFDVLSTSTNSTLDDLFVCRTNRRQVDGRCDPDNNQQRKSPGRCRLNRTNRAGSVPNISRNDSMSSTESRGPARISYIEPDNLSQNSSDLDSEQSDIRAAVSSCGVDGNPCVFLSPDDHPASSDINNILSHLINPVNCETPSSPNDHVLSYDQVYRILQTVRLSNLFNSVGSSSDSPTSPVISPSSFNGLVRGRRSNSFTSDASSFSVCSETGERRGSQHAIRNDAVYPETMHRNTLPINFSVVAGADAIKGLSDLQNINTSNAAGSKMFSSNPKQLSASSGMQTVAEDVECTEEKKSNNPALLKNSLKTTDQTRDQLEASSSKTNGTSNAVIDIYAKSRKKLTRDHSLQLFSDTAADNSLSHLNNKSSHDSHYSTNDMKFSQPSCDRRNFKDKPRTANFKQYGFIDNPVNVLEKSAKSSSKQNEKLHSKQNSFLQNSKPVSQQIHKRNNSDLGGSGADRNPHDIQHQGDFLSSIACGRPKKRPTSLALGKNKVNKSLFSDDDSNEKIQSKRTKVRKSYPSDHIRFTNNDIYNNQIMTSSGGTQDSMTSPDSAQDIVMSSATSDDMASPADSFNANALRTKPSQCSTLNGYVYDRAQPLTITHILDQNLNGNSASMNGRSKIFSYV